MHLKIFFIIAFFCVFCGNSIAKNTNQENDSLKSLLDSQIQSASYLCNLNTDSTIKIIEQVLDVAYKNNFKHEIAQALRIKGLVEFYRVNYSGALDLFIESRNIFKAIDDRKGEAKALENIALIYEQQGMIKKSLRMKESALNMRIEAKDSMGIARSLNNIAVSFKALEKHEKALTYYHQAVEISKAIGKYDDLNLYYNNIGAMYLKLQQPDSAYVYFHKSLKISNKYENKQIESNSFEYLGEYYMLVDDYTNAIKFLEKSLKLNKQIGIVYEIESVATKLHKAYAHIGKFKDAYKMHVLLKQMGDSANTMQTIQKISKLEAKAGFEKEREVQRLIQEKKEIEDKLELRTQKLIRNIAIILVLVALISLLFVFQNYKKKKRLSTNLMIQRDEILAQKEEIITQRDEIMVKKQTLEHQRIELITHRRNILDSLTYAEHIQGSLLPTGEEFDNSFVEHFIFFRPKDIVSGDFYWIKQKNGNTLFAAADCTGHGVPGAFMSIMGISFLNEIIQQQNEDSPAVILEKLRHQVKNTLNPELKSHKSKNYIELYLTLKIKDGMDMALCCMDNKTKKLTYSGAGLPMFIARNGEIIDFEPVDNPVGVHLVENPFINHSFQLMTNDIIYLFSDGYYDQFGGDNNKKYYIENFRKLLIEISNKPCAEQKKILEASIENWQGINDQIDDMLVMGLRV